MDKETEFFAKNPSLDEITDFNKKIADLIATQTLTEDLSSVADPLDLSSSTISDSSATLNADPFGNRRNLQDSVA